MSWAVLDASGQDLQAPLGAGPGSSPLPLLLGDRAVIEQAKGLLMAHDDCDASTAWALLCGHATANRLRIREMAQLRGVQPSSASACTPSSRSTNAAIIAR